MSWHLLVLLITLGCITSLWGLTLNKFSLLTNTGFLRGSTTDLSEVTGQENVLPSVEHPQTGVVDLDLASYIDQPYNGSKSDLVLKNVSLPGWYNYDKWDIPVWDPNADHVDILRRNSKRFISPLDEEEHIAMETFFNGVRNGLVVELGALDGIRYSVSRPLEVLFGWRSILVEAAPNLAKSLRTKRPEAVTINAAACSTPRMLHFVRSSDVGFLVGLTDPWLVKKNHKELVTNGKIDEKKVSKLPGVMCVPLGAILKALGVRHIDFLMLDCEGCEAEALQSLNLDDLTIDVLAVETKRADETAPRQEIFDIVSKASKKEEYEVYGLMGRNTWFVRKGFVKHSAVKTEAPKI